MTQPDDPWGGVAKFARVVRRQAGGCKPESRDVVAGAGHGATWRRIADAGFSIAMPVALVYRRA